MHALGDLVGLNAELFREFTLRGAIVRQEFVQRRIEETDGGREALQLLEHADEIFALVGQEFRQRSFAVVGVVGEDHFAHGVDAIAFEEHVLRAAEADAGRAERDRIRAFAPGCRRWCGPAVRVALLHHAISWTKF